MEEVHELQLQNLLRINIGGYLLWMAVLAVILLRGKGEASQRTPSHRPRALTRAALEFVLRPEADPPGEGRSRRKRIVRVGSRTRSLRPSPYCHSFPHRPRSPSVRPK